MAMGRRLHEIEWVKKWGWQLYNINLGTGAVAVVIASVPYQFHGQHELGTIFLIIDFLVYIVNIVMSVARARRYPQQFKQSFYDQSEGVYFPVCSIAMATLIINTLLYGTPYCGRWLAIACEAWYWFYVVFGACTSMITQSTLRTLPRPLKEIAPPDVLEIYPLMFIGVVGATLVPVLTPINPSRALTVWVFAYCMQGLGFFVGLLKLSVWMTHDMTCERASSGTIPSYLISVGVPGFTAYSIVNLGHSALQLLPSNSFFSGLGSSAPNPILVGQIFFTASIWFSFLLVGMATWMLLVFFGWGLLSFISEPKKKFAERWSFSWWSWTFPLSGLVTAFARYALYFPSRALGVLNIIFVMFIAIMWFVNIFGTVRMLLKGSLPGTDKAIDPQRISTEQQGSSGD